MTSTHQKAAQMLAAVADLLDQGQLINKLSVAVTAIAAAVLLVPVFPASTVFIPTGILVVLVGLVELAFAVRVGLGAALYRRLAADAAADRLDEPAAEAALVALRIFPAKKAALPIPQRVMRAKRLLLMQSAALLIQLLIAIGGAVTMFMEWV
jgi:hypothetical protein